MKFVQAYRNYSDKNFHYRPNSEKIKELKKITLFEGKKYFEKIWLSHSQHHIGS